MTTDNRTNEPTPEQVEAAAKELAVYEWVSWAVVPDHIKVMYRAQARAALVAAQGAAPQAESVSKSSYISPSLPAQIRGLYRADLRERSIQTMLDLAGDLIQELIDLKAAQVLPSSGVDEDKLAEVIEAHVLGEPNGGTASWAWINCSCGHRIEIAGVTRERVVALGRMHQARAVAEWLKGQGAKQVGWV